MAIEGSGPEGEVIRARGDGIFLYIRGNNFAVYHIFKIGEIRSLDTGALAGASTYGPNKRDFDTVRRCAADSMSITVGSAGGKSSKAQVLVGVMVSMNLVALPSSFPLFLLTHILYLERRRLRDTGILHIPTLKAEQFDDPS